MLKPQLLRSAGALRSSSRSVSCVGRGVDGFGDGFGDDFAFGFNDVALAPDDTDESVALLAASLLAVKRWIEQPLFRPGTVRGEVAIALPMEPPRNAATRAGFVDMGAGIELFTFECGQGPPSWRTSNA